MKKSVPVAAAWLMDSDGRVLLCRRRPEKARGGYWEFPGGKLEEKETPREAVERELREELGIGARGRAELVRTVHSYPEITIELILVEAVEPEGSIYLTDHSEIRWCRTDEIGLLDLAPADRDLLGLLFDSNALG